MVCQCVDQWGQAREYLHSLPDNEADFVLHYWVPWANLSGETTKQRGYEHIHPPTFHLRNSINASYKNRQERDTDTSTKGPKLPSRPQLLRFRACLCISVPIDPNEEMHRQHCKRRQVDNLKNNPRHHHIMPHLQSRRNGHSGSDPLKRYRYNITRDEDRRVESRFEEGEVRAEGYDDVFESEVYAGTEEGGGQEEGAYWDLEPGARVGV